MKEIQALENAGTRYHARMYHCEHGNIKAIELIMDKQATMATCNCGTCMYMNMNMTCEVQDAVVEGLQKQIRSSVLRIRRER